MDYILAKVSLMVSAIALSKGRHFAFCLFFFYNWALFKLVMPDPSAFVGNPAAWYWLCLSGEASIIALALILKPNAIKLIIACSVVEILANSVSIWSHAIYSFYPNIIRVMEISQLVVLIIWSPISLRWLSKLRERLQEIKERPWMRRLLKLPTT